MHPAAWLVLGLILLIISGEILVRGAVGIATKLRVSTLVIGMTVVSFGTSAPELFVSLDAALDGNPEIAVGNVVGSNIANLALVLSITVLIFPLLVDRNSIRIDWPMMMLATAMFWLFSLDGLIERWEGVVLFAVLLAFVYFLVRNSRRNPPKDDDEKPDLAGWKVGVFLLGGLTGLYFGAEWLVDGAIGIAESYGVNQHIIAVTVVAFGTSVPELVASCVAAFKKEMDISVGNLIGSNVFNIMAVIGLTAIVTDIQVEKNVIENDMWWVAGISMALLPIMVINKRKIGRAQGVILLASYIIYVYLLISTGV